MKNWAFLKWNFSPALLAALLAVWAGFWGAPESAAGTLPLSSGDFSGAPVSGSALDVLMKSLAGMNTFDAELYGLEGCYEVVGEINGKLEENRGPDRIRLVGLRRENGVYNRGFLIEVIPSGGDPFVIPMPDGVRGFEQSIALRNFTSREKSEILLTVGGGKWGNRFLVIAAAGKKGEVILDTGAADVKIPAVTGRFLDNYRAEIAVPETGERAMIDLSPRKAEYNRRLIYNESGTLRRGVTVWMDKLSLFETVDLDGDGVMEIREVMDLNGVGRADRVAYVEASLKYADGAWSVIDSWIAPAEDLSKIPAPVRIK